MAMVTVRRRAILGGAMVARNASTRKRPDIKNGSLDRRGRGPLKPPRLNHPIVIGQT
jgi:hypothetical protein